MNALQDFRIHFKGLPYRMIGTAQHSESLEAFVTYQALYRSPNEQSLWIRPREMFEEEVRREGVLHKRFRKVSHLKEVPQSVVQKVWIPDFADVNYLADGSFFQRQAFEVLAETHLLTRLRPFGAVLAGTFPLDLVCSGSDLDILCHASSKQDVFHALDGLTTKDSGESTIEVLGFPIPIEIYVEDTPVQEQRGYRHLIAEARLLAMGGPKVENEIYQLKVAGMKTEPAFAEVFELWGDPYEALLKYATTIEP
jgi:hypothetical protein